MRLRVPWSIPLFGLVFVLAAITPRDVSAAEGGTLADPGCGVYPSTSDAASVFGTVDASAGGSFTLEWTAPVALGSYTWAGLGLVEANGNQFWSSESPGALDTPAGPIVLAWDAGEYGDVSLVGQWGDADTACGMAMEGAWSFEAAAAGGFSCDPSCVVELSEDDRDLLRLQVFALVTLGGILLFSAAATAVAVIVRGR